jgi:hypothetical protein
VILGSCLCGAESVTWYPSSEKVQRGSCSICGSTQFWNPTIEGYEWTAVARGCIDTPLELKVSKHRFVGNKGGHYEITDDAHQSQAF